MDAAGWVVRSHLEDVKSLDPKTHRAIMKLGRLARELSDAIALCNYPAQKRLERKIDDEMNRE